MNFRAIPESRRPNRWLICPPGYANREPDEHPPVFGVGVEELRAAWRDLIAGEARAEVLRDDPDGMDLVQRTRLFRFADDIGVTYIPLAGGRSTIALFSRSRVGWSDLGVNRRRLRRWLTALCRRLPVLSGR
jgi:uncharacterized protein (DUF1499 family)